MLTDLDLKLSMNVSWNEEFTSKFLFNGRIKT